MKPRTNNMCLCERRVIRFYEYAPSSGRADIVP